MTAKETMKALGEMIQTETEENKVEHLFELANTIAEEGQEPFEEWDSDVNLGTLEELDIGFDSED